MRPVKISLRFALQQQGKAKSKIDVPINRRTPAYSSTGWPESRSKMRESASSKGEEEQRSGGPLRLINHISRGRHFDCFFGVLLPFFLAGVILILCAPISESTISLGPPFVCYWPPPPFLANMSPVTSEVPDLCYICECFAVRLLMLLPLCTRSQEEEGVLLSHLQRPVERRRTLTRAVARCHNAGPLDSKNRWSRRPSLDFPLCISRPDGPAAAARAWT